MSKENILNTEERPLSLADDAQERLATINCTERRATRTKRIL